MSNKISQEGHDLLIENIIAGVEGHVEIDVEKVRWNGSHLLHVVIRNVTDEWLAETITGVVAVVNTEIGLIPEFEHLQAIPSILVLEPVTGVLVMNFVIGNIQKDPELN